ncbi:MAG: hypothetical protein HC921_18680 [Synechococcaceae cyanobacterium SM2_3_1]|nr:hypothetical protein [Synechococcaceae cyanobacterium SM2_3_1]
MAPFHWPSLGLLLAGLLIAQPAWSLTLGEQISENATLTEVKQGPHSYAAVQEETSTQTITALLNENNQVFAILIRSQATTPPDPAQYLGDYADFPHKEPEGSPLRGQQIRYSRGEREAEWSVYGMSGQFSAHAFSLDLAPAEMLPSKED